MYKYTRPAGSISSLFWDTKKHASTSRKEAPAAEQPAPKGTGEPEPLAPAAAAATPAAPRGEPADDRGVRQDASPGAGGTRQLVNFTGAEWETVDTSQAKVLRLLIDPGSDLSNLKGRSLYPLVVYARDGSAGDAATLARVFSKAALKIESVIAAQVYINRKWESVGFCLFDKVEDSGIKGIAVLLLGCDLPAPGTAQQAQSLRLVLPLRAVEFHAKGSLEGKGRIAFALLAEAKPADGVNSDMLVLSNVVEVPVEF